MCAWRCWPIGLVLVVGCGGEADNSATQPLRTSGGTVLKGTYADDVAFLKKHTEVVELTGAQGEAIAVVPAYQGRVMTSAFDAKSGAGLGWINYDIVEKGKPQPHITVYGGEDRFWIGPEGGQFSVFFKAGDEQNLDAWQTPALIDSEPYALAGKSKSEAVFTKSASLTNYSDTTFSLGIKRTVALIDKAAVEKAFNTKLPDGVKTVAYETRNEVSNEGSEPWDKKSGLPSIWILGMFKHSPTTLVIAPFNKDGKGAIVNDDYFGKVPEDRFQTKDGFAVFKADGQFRSKIGLSPSRAKDVVGSYDPVAKVLTIVQYNKPSDATDYVNSKWVKHQDDPFSGDVVNSYNDGPPEPGKKPLGPFYELETSSPALALAPKEKYTHVHRTVHMTGSHEALNKVSQAVLGVDLDKAVISKP